MTRTYTYDEVISELEEEKNVGSLCFKDIKEIYSLSFCWDNKIKWCKDDGGHYKDEDAYSERVRKYIKSTQFRRYVGHHPFEKLVLDEVLQ